MKSEIEMNSANLKELEREMMNEINEIIKKYQDKIKLAEELYKVKETWKLLIQTFQLAMARVWNNAIVKTTQPYLQGHPLLGREENDNS